MRSAVFCPFAIGISLLGLKLPPREAEPTYMIVQAEIMCVVIPSLPHMSLNTQLMKEYELFCDELYVM
jgi:hypothetical protein